MESLKGLKPELVWSIFEQICQVPRPSKKEEKIAAFLMNFAVKHNLKAKQDEVGNVLISGPATPGKENVPTIVLQAHMDMVCEKNSDVQHDFDKDPIQPYIDGEWVKAKGTTLGADDGVGIAAGLAVLTSTDLEHGPIECLFTVDEETGLTGAFAIKPNFFTGNILLNLDSEDEGEMFIGCAGGVDTEINLPYKEEATKTSDFAVKLSIKGLAGGHSGDDINKGKANAIKVLNKFIWDINKKYEVRVVKFEGGNLRNAIAREANAIIVFEARHKEDIRIAFNTYAVEMEYVWKLTEPNIKMDLQSCPVPEMAMTPKDSTNFLNAIYAAPHGVFSMSSRMPGMVETSTNLASVKFNKKGNIYITTSQRSDLDSEKYNIAGMVTSVFELAGAEVKQTEPYPGWAPNTDSKILTVLVESYEKLFGKKPVVRSIHAGLECGLFLEKYPNMDMVSFGPTLKGVHSPDEKINIKTVEMWWSHLTDVLKNIK